MTSWEIVPVSVFLKIFILGNKVVYSVTRGQTTRQLLELLLFTWGCSSILTSPGKYRMDDARDCTSLIYYREAKLSRKAFGVRTMQNKTARCSFFLLRHLRAVRYLRAGLFRRKAIPATKSPVCHARIVRKADRLGCRRWNFNLGERSMPEFNVRPQTAPKCAPAYLFGPCTRPFLPYLRSCSFLFLLLRPRAPLYRHSGLFPWLSG